MEPIYYSLTHPQKRIWYMEKRYPGTCLSTIAAVLKLTGAVDTTLLAQAIQRTIAAHDGLRLRLTEDDTEQLCNVQQFVMPYDVQEFTVLNFSEAEELETWAEQQTKIPFVLLDSQLSYFAIFRLGNDQGGGFYLKLHHIISDGWTMHFLIQSILDTYEKLQQGVSYLELEKVEQVSYLDYIQSEAGYLQSAVFQEDQDFWLAQYVTVPEEVNLAFSEGQLSDISTERLVFELPDSIYKAALVYCQTNHISLFQLFFTVLYIYIARVTGDYDSVITIAHHGRVDPRYRKTVGMFVSTLPVRVTCQGDFDFTTTQQAVSNRLRECIRHQKYPYDRLAEILQERGLPVDGLLTINLVQVPDYRNLAAEFDSVAGLELSWINTGVDSSPLSIYINPNSRESQGVLELAIDYQSSLFSRPDIERLSERLMALLADVVQQPSKSLSELAIMSGEEEQQVLVDFNKTQASYPIEQTIVDLFETQVAQVPEHTALVWREQRMTYGQLNAKANQLAGELRQRGVKPDVVVGILANRSLEMLVGVLAVIKAGGAYMPIDPAYPDERILYMLRDSNATILLSQQSLVERSANFRGDWLDLEDPLLYRGDSCNLSPVVSSSHMVYMIYTSGSTGNPKGVMIEHRSLVNLCQWQNEYHNITAADSTAFYSGFGFDASIWEIIPFLTAGAAVHIIGDDLRLSPLALNEYFEAHKITIADLPTQFAEQFMELTNNQSLRRLVTGGDKLKQYKLGGYTLINEYGPTEYTISATAYTVEDQELDQTIPIGKPLANTQIYILDQNQRPLPIGVPGEMYISGVGLARGYWNKPEVTAEKFVPNPFVPGTRMYRTGDLVRWQRDGNLEFVGRLDFQVKLRGFRIELGEIEQRLIEHEAVRQAVVLDHEDSGGGKYLCAYLVTRSEITGAEMKGFLRRYLPEYMIPSYVMMLAEIPLTANGKVDRRALPAPALDSESIMSYVAARSELEVILVDIWQEILGVPRIGIEDNFFSIGGNSLKAGILQAKIQKLLQVKIGLTNIFQYPTINQLAQCVEGEQRDVGKALAPAPKLDYYPLSMGQQRIFAVSQMEGIGASYNMTLGIMVEGILDLARMEEAINQLIDRHEMLRTSFSIIDGQSVQKITPSGQWGRLQLEQLRVKPEQAEERDYLNQIIQGFVRSFDLSKGPLIHVGAAELGPNRWFLIIDVHHIVFDGLSLSIFMEELSIVYGGNSLPKLNTQYRDYAVWQAEQNFESSPTLAKHETYWLGVFTGDIPVLNMPIDYPRQAVQSFSGKRFHFKVERDLLEELEELATRQGATLYMVLLAAFQTLLARYSGQEDIIIGSPAAGRTHADLDRVVGMFVNTLPIRCQPALDKTFVDFLAEVKEQALKAMDHQDYQFNTLVEKLGLKRDVSRNPLFDVMFALQNGGLTELTLPGVHISYVPFERDASQFDLTLDLETEESGLIGVFEYCDQLFSHQTIQSMAGHFLNILGAIVREPQQKLGEVAMLSTEERALILSNFNATERPFPLDQTTHSLFESMALQNPHKVALVWQDTSLTYGELNAKANRLARTLREQGVGPDSIVAILVKRNPGIIIGSLAVMKAGGAYLPIDPSYPEERIAYMLEDSGAVALLTEASLQEKAGAYQGPCLDLTEETWFAADASNLESVSGPTNLAYVIYTSGSTGKPKGVMVEHRNLVNLCLWHHHYHQVTSADVGATYSGFGFDASIWEMYPFLTIGACLHIIPEELRLSPEEVNAYFETHQITITNLPTQFCEQFMELTDNQSLKTLVTGGDKLKTYRPQRYRLVNEYGPTEYTISATAFLVDKLYDNIPIGKPLANTWTYILDQYGNPQPIGVAGELCIAGAQLVRGYLNRPELTAEKFVDNPYQTGVANAKMYKTGDLVRWLPDGTLEFLGRMDQQVKIRGYRIELGEIEQRLLQHIAVRDAVVFDREDSSGSSYLCAYFVASQAQAVETNELKLFLGKELPSYMVPSYFIEVASIPLTSNGKVDKQALPKPDMAVVQEKTAYVDPRNDIETCLVTVWQEVLRVERIGIDDAFFALGGDSIKAIQVIGRLGKNQLKLEMKHIFQHPTIRDLSHYVVNVVRDVDNRPIEGEVLLTPIQQWFFEADFTDMHHWNQSMLLIREAGIDIVALTEALRAVAEHHDALRMVYRFSGKNVIQYNQGVTGVGPLFSLRVLEGIEETNTALTERLAVEANLLQRSIDLGTGPLLQAAVCKTKQGDYLILVVHHLVIDGVSWRIIQEDLATAYGQACRREKIQLPIKTDSYQRWAKELRKYAVSPKLLKQCDYWRKIEQESIPPLPVDQVVVGKKRLQDNGVVNVTFTYEETNQLLKTAHAVYHTTTSDLLLAGLGLAVNGWTGQDKVLITLEGHGREEIMPDVDISRTVGWFTSTYPVLLDIEQKDDLGYLLKSIKENLRRIPDHGMGSDILRHLTPAAKRGFDYSLRPEIEFNYLGEMDNNEELGQSIFSLVHVRAGEDFSSASEMDFKLLVSAMVIDGKLMLSIEYSELEYEEETIEVLLKRYQENLQSLLRHCSTCVAEVTPSDLGDLDLTLEELATIQEICGPSITSIYPLTPMQEGMLFLSRFQQDSHAYFEQEVLEVKGDIDLILFEKNLNEVIARHDILRTAFVFETIGRSRQVVLQERPTTVYFEDISSWEGQEQNDYIERVQREDRNKGFDLTRDHLLRLSILKKNQRHYIIICSFPHIILDGWCMAKFTSELFDGYLLMQKNLPVLFEKTLPFRNYVEWLEEQDKEVALQAWQDYLSGLENQTHLPMVGAVQKSSLYQPEDVLLRFDKAVTLQFNELARQHKVTLNIVIQAIWGLLLQRYNNTTDVVFGTVVSGRPPEIPDVDQIMGLFINTVPVRVTASKTTSFAQLLQTLQASALAVEPYSYCSLAEIQACSLLKEGLISNIVAFENIPIGVVMEDSEFSVESVGGFDQINYNFGLVIFPDEEIIVRFSYNAAVFEQFIVENMAQHFRQAAEQILNNPQISVGEVDILSSRERQLVLTDFNTTELDCPLEQTVYSLFESMAALYPDKVALVWQDTSLTYGELNAKANRLVRTLREQGVGPDSIVAILVSRNPGIIIGSLAVMKAGGAYLPIDPSYPEERIAYMLEDSGAVALLTEASLQEKAGAYQGPCLDLTEETWFAADASNLESISGPTNLAYVIYTSGSTGKPKGVLIEHRNLVNLCFWHHDYHKVTSADVGATYSGFGFDASIWEMYPFLTIGACLHIIPEELRLSPEEVNAYFETHQVTITNLPTQFCEQFMELTDNQSLKTLVTGGDKLKTYRPQRYRLVNEYGPTEYTISATAFLVDKLYDNIPIGKPIANTWTYILDQFGNPQPIGVAGELCIAGAQLARGYLNRPELTAEKFVDNPYQTGASNAKMYKTGDLVRWLPDGNLEFLGRMDQQVKIRGYRIELGEIEQRLMQHVAVRDAVVLDRQDTSGNSYLCAYFVSSQDQAVETNELKSFLGEELPSYMVPSFFIQLASIPLTSNGKVDKRALPEPDGQLNIGTDYVAPRNEIEHRLVQIWQEILGVPRIGIHDNFFNVGGHSLKIAMLATKIQQVFEVKLTFAELFQLLTVSELSGRIQQQTGSERLNAILPISDQAYYPLSPAQKRMFVLEQMEGIGTTYHITSALFLEGPLDKEKLSQAILQMVNRHEVLRTSFVMVDDQPVQQVHPQIKFKRILREVGELSDDAINGLVDEFVKKFDLGHPPLFRLELLELSKTKHLLLFDIHHIIFDGVSMGIFWEELFAIYRGTILPTPRLQYRDVAAWQNQRLESQSMNFHEKYWLDVFAGNLPLLNLPTDYSRPAHQSYEGDNLTFVLNQELTVAIQQLAKETKTTQFSLFLAAYYLLLAKYAGQEDIIVGVPSAGRPHADLEEVIGMFVSTLPLRAYPNGSKTFSRFLGEVANHVVEALDHQEYPLEQLVEKLCLPRDSSHNPLFDVMFSFTHQEGLQEASELTITPWEGASPAAQFDLTLEVAEQGEMIEVGIEYRTKLFTAKTIESMAGHFRQILREITADCEKKLADIKMLTEGEEQQLLVDFNQTKLTYPVGKTIQELFTLQVGAYPDKTALVFRDQQWTYRELDERTNQLARTLRAKGVKPDSIVAIMVGRSADIVLGTLAVLKAGGAYLPIDPEYPAERIQYMLTDSGAVLLLSQQSLRDKASGFGGEWLDMAADLYDQSGQEVALINKSSDLAYVIYTSGSTGKPKGVMIEHGNLVNLCTWQQQFHQVMATDNAATYSGFGFDASVWEMYPFLTIGATLHIIPDELRLSPVELNAYFETHEITITNLPTQFCEQFMELADNKSLKTLVTGGDKLKTYRLQNYRLVNEYGPTEYTISATAFLVDKQYSNIPIGKPLANTWAYILDAYSHLQPIGVPGELCLAGAQLARGYLNQPELTREKFVDNPFRTGAVNAKMYRTGDLVRWLPDGNLEFLGRVDQQVKIRGYRIELGEIEQQLLEYPGISGAVVIDLPDGRGEKYLAAYVALLDAEPLDDTLLNSHLRQGLPDYMIPTFLIQLPAIPLTANGKVDRRALPLPELANRRSDRSAMPTTAAELKIAQVWRDVLGMSELGVHDNFFSLGGNSLKAVAAAAKLQKSFEVSVNQLFEYQTIATLASQLSLKTNNLKNKLAELKELAQGLDETAIAQDTVDLVVTERQRDYQLANGRYQQKNLTVGIPYQHLLLTGVTGYLGIHLLKELLESTSCHMYLPIRGDNNVQANSRLREKVSYYFGEQAWSEFGIEKRVTVFNGSLERENLGLPKEVYEELAEKVEVIIHSAGNVRHYGHYSEFWQSNVKATQELLQFAQTGKTKDFNYMSTVSIASGVVAKQEQVVFTEAESDLGQELDNYYLKTKLEAEQAVIGARDNLKTTIFRIGNIVFHSKSGRYQDNIEDNAFYSLIKAFVNLGVVPKIMDEAEFSYVDQVAKAVVLLFDRQALVNETYHIYNSQTVKLSEVLTDASLRVNVRSVEFSTFIDYLYNHYDQVGYKEYIESVMLHFGWLDDESGESGKENTQFTVLSDKTNGLLTKLGFNWEELNPTQMKGIIRQALRERIEFLGSVPFLTGLSTVETELLAGLATQKNFDDERDILWEDEINDEFYMIMDGFVEVSRSSVGGWQGTLAVAGRGSFIGEEIIMGAGPSSVTAEAILGEVVTLAYSSKTLQALIGENPKLAMALMQGMNDKIRRLEKMVVSMA